MVSYLKKAKSLNARSDNDSSEMNLISFYFCIVSFFGRGEGGRTYYVCLADLELTEICLSLLPEGWD